MLSTLDVLPHQATGRNLAKVVAKCRQEPQHIQEPEEQRLAAKLHLAWQPASHHWDPTFEDAQEEQLLKEQHLYALDWTPPKHCRHPSLTKEPNSHRYSYSFQMTLWQS